VTVVAPSPRFNTGLNFVAPPAAPAGGQIEIDVLEQNTQPTAGAMGKAEPAQLDCIHRPLAGRNSAGNSLSGTGTGIGT
jgi:hypothetical protein